uniref:Uncharacterized protein n=1 Tax=Romanomermis culicivorax TaxID=13658 RepID=A0A915IE71_ROMCU
MLKDIFKKKTGKVKFTYEEQCSNGSLAMKIVCKLFLQLIIHGCQIFEKDNEVQNQGNDSFPYFNAFRSMFGIKL